MQLIRKNNHHNSHLWWYPVSIYFLLWGISSGCDNPIPQEDQNFSTDTVQLGSGSKRSPYFTQNPVLPIHTHTAGWWGPGLRSLQVAKGTRIQSDAFPEAQGFWRQAGIVATVCLNISLMLRIKLTARYCCQMPRWWCLSLCLPRDRSADLAQVPLEVPPGSTELVSRSRKYARSKAITTTVEGHSPHCLLLGNLSLEYKQAKPQSRSSFCLLGCSFVINHHVVGES